MIDLELCDLQLSLQGKPVLQDINLLCAAGEFVVLAGPSGSGKSTLLRAVAGLLQIDGGQILASGQRLDTLPPGQREVALVFQDHALMPHLSVADNLAFGLRARGMKKTAALQQAVEVAERLGLTELLPRKPAQISGGEQQRVALGRAMLRQAKLVLMDEPLSSLDAPLRARLRREILKLHREQGWTTLYVTHDQAEALSMADKLGVLQQGRLLQFDTPAQIYRAPSSLDVAKFIGHPRMNVLPLRSSSKTDLALLADGNSAASFYLGLRAEDMQIHVSSDAITPDHAQIGGQVTDIEFMGDQTIVHVACDAVHLLVRYPVGASFQVGDVVLVSFNPQSGRVFDSATGQAVA